MTTPATHHETPETATFERRVLDLQVGDVIVQEGCIDLKVDAVSDVMHGFVNVSYLAGPNDSLADTRAMVAGSIVTVRRPVPA